MPVVLVEKSVLPSLWWSSLLAESIRMVKVNVSARLPVRERMARSFFQYNVQLVEAAARHETLHPLLMGPGVVDALEYIATHEVVDTYITSAYITSAAGALVELLGRKEGGKTLGEQTVFAVLELLKAQLQDGHYRSLQPLISLTLELRRVATMAISDANKRIMLQFGGLMDTLVKALLLDSPRRNEAGGDAVQEASAGVLASLALFGPGAEALRGHGGVMDALRSMRDGVSSTEASRQSAVQALFQLEERKAVRASSGGGGKHIMMSYNWDHQSVIKRIHAALVQRGYRMWIDVEQMKGSTVDAMSLAVEDAAVVLIGVSRAYKESTNCRLEAQYAMQREVDTVPLMLVEGYRADGWLGMLIGTRMWYGFYGASASESAVFKGKIEELCRELGERGLSSGDGDVGVSGTADGGGATTDSGGSVEQQLRTELGLLKVAELRKRALSSGVSEEAVEGAFDADNPKAALVSLVVVRRMELGAVCDFVEKLRGGGEEAAAAVTEMLEGVIELLDAQSSAAPRKLRKGLLELLDRVETACESSDAEWCDGVAVCEGVELERLGSLLVSASDLGSGVSAEEAVSLVSELLDCVEECGSVVVRAMSGLRRASAGGVGGDDACLGAFEMLRCLSAERQESVSSKEALAAELVMECLASE
jgi:hypothetical protein